MTSNELIGRVYGNSGNDSEKERIEEPQITVDVDNGKASNNKKNRKREQKDNETILKPKRQCTTYKYSNKGKGTLHEAVIIAGMPVFLNHENGEIKIVENIEEANRTIKPPHAEEYPYEPYEFTNLDEVREYTERVKLMSIDSLYTQVKQFVADYNDQDAHKLTLIALDIIFSYFQDKFATTHYVSIVGDNDSGKSSLGITFEALAYRPVYMTDPSAANIFRCLGTIEPGQCSIILDEADKIDKSLETMAILKTGYQLNGKVPKINTNSLRQEFFCTYCLKIIIAEKSMSLIEAKGVHDRTFSFTAYPGDSAFDIKETLNPQGDPECQRRLNELLSFRKLLLIYRLLHFKDAVTNIDIGLKRSRELVKPILQLFCNAELKIQKEIVSALEGFLKTKNAIKNTIEAALYPMISNMVSQYGRELFARDIWKAIIADDIIRGYYDEKRPNEYQTADYGTIYRNSITNVICDKLGAQKKHKETGSVLIFDIDKLVKIGKSYELETHVQLKLPEEDHKPDGPDSSDGFSKTLTTSKDNHNTEITNNDGNHINISEGNPDNHVNNTAYQNENPSVIPIKSSEPSEPSGDKVPDTTLIKDNGNGEAATTKTTTIATNITTLADAIYWREHSGDWGCKRCRLNGDRFLMQKHNCSGKK